MALQTWPLEEGFEFKHVDFWSLQNLDFCDTSPAIMDFYKIQWNPTSVKTMSSIQKRCSNMMRSMAEIPPNKKQSMHMAPNVDLEPTLGSKFSFWDVFGRCWKAIFFDAAFWCSKKSKKSSLQVPKGRHEDFEGSARVPFNNFWVPGRPQYQRSKYIRI